MSPQRPRPHRRSTCFDNPRCFPCHRFRSQYEKPPTSSAKVAPGLAATGGSRAETVPAPLCHESRVVAAARRPTRRPARAAPALIMRPGAALDPRVWPTGSASASDDIGQAAGCEHRPAPGERWHARTDLSDQLRGQLCGTARRHGSSGCAPRTRGNRRRFPAAGHHAEAAIACSDCCRTRTRLCGHDGDRPAKPACDWQRSWVMRRRLGSGLNRDNRAEAGLLRFKVAKSVSDPPCMRASCPQVAGRPIFAVMTICCAITGPANTGSDNIPSTLW